MRLPWEERREYFQDARRARYLARVAGKAADRFVQHEDKIEPATTFRSGAHDDAIALVTKTRQASISMIQRHLRVGYNRAARMIEVMEKEGVVGPSDGVKPREVLVTSYERRK